MHAKRERMKRKGDIHAVVFDLGGVLIDWDPRHLYRKVFDDEKVMEEFLGNICTPDWNEQQDAGRPVAVATKERISKFPEYRTEIEAFYGRWEEMLGGPVKSTLDLLHEVKKEGKWGLYALTNWSAETFPIARARYSFLDLFEDIIVSGEVKCKKPDPKIYQILVERTGVDPENSLFIDDSERNIMAARNLGFQTIHFDSPDRVKEIRKILFPAHKVSDPG